MAIREPRKTRTIPIKNKTSGEAPQNILEQVNSIHRNKRQKLDLSLPTQKSIKSVWDTAYSIYRGEYAESNNAGTPPPLSIPISRHEASILVQRINEIDWGATLVWHTVLSSVIEHWKAYFDTFAFRTYNKAPTHPELLFIAHNWRTLVKEYIDKGGKVAVAESKAGELVKRRKEERKDDELQKANDGLAAVTLELEKLREKYQALSQATARLQQTLQELKKDKDALEKALHKERRAKGSLQLSSEDIAANVTLPGKII